MKVFHSYFVFRKLGYFFKEAIGKGQQLLIRLIKYIFWFGGALGRIPGGIFKAKDLEGVGGTPEPKVPGGAQRRSRL
ncbi:MAG: hypothetical protein MJY43_03420, partial [Bacteroidales bacterium]|nr:hypothetical protein [Bacteroidales bacterium]